MTKAKPRVLERSAGHKRRATELPPAHVHCTSEEILIIVPDVLGKNEIHRTGPSGRYTSRAAQEFRRSMQDGVNAWRNEATMRTDLRGTSHDVSRMPLSTVLGWSQAMSDAWHLDVTAIWPRERHAIGGRPVDYGPAPMGDVDAAPTPALDAMKHAGVLDDDARVLSMTARTMLARTTGRRATVIRLARLALGPRNVAETSVWRTLAAAFPEDIPDDPPPTALRKRRTKR